MPEVVDEGTLDAICGSDPFVRQLVSHMRSGRGTSLEEAVRDLREITGPVPQLAEAAARVREYQETVKTADEPRGIIGDGIESWYLGPRVQDHNWPSLVELLRADGWESGAIDDLDGSSTKVVAQLPSPHGAEYHCRGLVLGYVQSGKTTNFTAVIAKAADAGYRVFIVLSGMHNGLRQQTQARLNDQLWKEHPDLWHRLTDDTDFSPSPNVDAVLSAQGEQRVIAVVKKHGGRLRRLRDWLFDARPDVLQRCPVLIIDDEADQATPNTAKPDREPRVINGLIREIVNNLPKSAYVGYTATPFANVLIDAANYEDLYPRDFIIDLPRPEEYVGPETLFGREPLEFDEEGDLEEGHDLIRSVPEEDLPGLRPTGRRAQWTFEPEITDSLDEALRWFLLSTAARRVRGVGNRHATALIHTSQYRLVHDVMAEAVRAHVEVLKHRLAERHRPTLDALRDQWEMETAAVTADEFELEPVAWDAVAARLSAVLADLEVIVDNSTSTERLDYTGSPKVVVAIGGNTLSRGLTLEGLSVSYFVRTASAYDTLLQMGRWFGYRRGYADLTRVWMTDEMRGWFHHLATVEREIRYDIERYERDRLNPMDVGMRIRTHPQLAVTAAAKMQHAVPAKITYSGRRLQTILFNHRDRAWLDANIDAARALISRTSDAPRRAIRGGITVIGPVASADILGFLAAYQFHPESRDLNAELVQRYIRERNVNGELTHFSVAVMGRDPRRVSSGLGDLDLGMSTPVGCINRARLLAIGGRGYADIKALMSKSDRVIDLDVQAAELVGIENGELAGMRNPPEQGGRGDGSGLLALYPISKDSLPIRNSRRTREKLGAVQHVLGVGLVFPRSRDEEGALEYLTVDLSHARVGEPDEEDEDDPGEGVAA